MKRPTIASLQAEIDSLQPHAYLTTAMLKGEKPTVFRSDCEDERNSAFGFEVHVYAPAASHGGIVVLLSDGELTGSVLFLERWSNDAQRASDPYIASLARKVWRFHVEAMNEKYGKKASGS